MHVHYYADRLTDTLAEQIHWQITDPDHPQYGGICLEKASYAHPRSNACFLAATAILAAQSQSTGRSYHLPEPETLQLCLKSLARMQRDSGLWDEATCNYEATPDTGFVVQLLCLTLTCLRQLDVSHPIRQLLQAGVEQCLINAAKGLAPGGHHTPNHRWIISSALAWTMDLLPEADSERARATIDAYKAEGIDINDDGVFLERSVLVYDNVNHRAMLILAAFNHWPQALDAAVKSMLFNRYLLHPDMTVDTGLSTRQDHGDRKVPVDQLANLLWAYAQKPTPELAGVIHMIDQYLQNHQDSTISFSALTWIMGMIHLHGVPETTGTAIPQNYTKNFPNAGICRLRTAEQSISLYHRNPTLLSAVFGPAHLAAMYIQVSYFGPAGHFMADRFTQENNNRFVMHSTGHRHPRRPGYDLPIGQHVGADLDDWHNAEAQRQQKRLPHAEADLTIDRHPDGLEMHLQMGFGIDQVTGMLAFDFAPGGYWQTADCLLQPQPGQELILTAGTGLMRYGSYAISLSPGCDDHRTFAMRDSHRPGGNIRVIVPFFTPIDQSFQIRFIRGAWPVIRTA